MTQRPGRNRFGAGLGAGLLLFALAGGARGQEEAPVFGQQRQYEWIHFDPPSLSLELLGRWQDNTQSPHGQPELATQETLYRQLLNIDDHAYSIHPNLVDLRLAGSIGLEERDFHSSDTGTNNSTGTVYDYDLSALILRNQEYPVTLYARRHEALAYRDFGPTMNTISSAYGGILEVRSRTLPSRFELSHQTEELVDPQGLQGFTLDRDTLQWETQWRPTEWHTLAWAYAYNSIDTHDSTGTNTAFQTQDLSLSDSHDFGAERLSNLTSSATYFTQQGDFPQSRLRLDEYLRLHHTRDFETHYEYTYDQQDQELGQIGQAAQTLDQQQHRLQAGFRHQLYESLTTTGNVGWSKLTTNGGDEITERYGELAFDYHKKVPLGLFSANLTGAYNWRDSSAQSSAIQILNEPDTFVDPTPVLLSRPGVVPSSIVITDAAGTRIFSPIFDYAVVALPDRVQISRVPGGAIANDQTVLVDYVVQPQPANTTTTTGVGLGARYDFREGWLRNGAVYAKYFIQDQSVVTNNPQALVPDNIRALTLGAQYAFWHVTLSAEWQDHASSVAPFRATRFNALYQERARLDTIVALNANYTMLEYLDINDRTDFFAVSGSVEHAFSPELYGVLSAGWRDERGQLLGSSTGFEEQAQLKWRHRQTTVFTTVRHVTFDTESQNNEFLLVEVGIQRAF